MHPLVLVAGAGSPASPQPTDSLYEACGRTQNPGIACRLVWDVTHSTKAAELTTVYFAGPAQLVIRIGYVLLIAVVLRLIAHRAISRITSRATRNGGDASDRTRALLFRERRQQRAAALGAILSNAASLTIFGIAAVIIIGDMGLNLAPVLASAGSPGRGHRVRRAEPGAGLPGRDLHAARGPVRRGRRHQRGARRPERSRG